MPHPRDGGNKEMSGSNNTNVRDETRERFSARAQKEYEVDQVKFRRSVTEGGFYWCLDAAIHPTLAWEIDVRIMMMMMTRLHAWL